MACRPSQPKQTIAQQRVSTFTMRVSMLEFYHTQDRDEAAQTYVIERQHEAMCSFTAGFSYNSNEESCSLDCGFHRFSGVFEFSEIWVYM